MAGLEEEPSGGDQPHLTRHEVNIVKVTVATRNVEKAILVGVDSNRGSGWTAEESLAELARLAGTAGVMVVGRLIQRLSSPLSTQYLGKGKLAELAKLRETLGYTLAIFDDELSPIQQRNLEGALEVKVIDRVVLILDIFARRARTREGQLQVELAQHKYLLPRLAGQWSHLERLGGGIGTRGPGETQLETDKRLIQRRIKRLEAQIDDIKKHRELYWQKRQRAGIAVVALVGYTNAGKSSLMNALTRAGVTAEDKLFSTLDPTTRRLALPGGQTVLLSDTVGFIRKLPPSIIEAFKATLEELEKADLLIHVVDISIGNSAEQCQVVENILTDLGLAKKTRLMALNKIDLVLAEKDFDETAALDYFQREQKPTDENTIFVSAARNWGIKQLIQRIKQVIPEKGSATS
jgi:GTPase